ncbi:hypothetical protein F4811DRAFT_540398 [Daldinia bambusicola]|nr:hypothetical protein F4811DRAFT_540398 [Daldinia bambusicola]
MIRPTPLPSMLKMILIFAIPSIVVLIGQSVITAMTNQNPVLYIALGALMAFSALMTTFAVYPPQYY